MRLLARSHPWSDFFTSLPAERKQQTIKRIMDTTSEDGRALSTRNKRRMKENLSLFEQLSIADPCQPLKQATATTAEGLAQSGDFLSV